MKITRKNFVEVMTKNTSYFAGTAWKLLSQDELYCKLPKIIDNDFDGLVNVRSCSTYGTKYLEFSGGSLLEVASTPNVKKEFYEYDYPKTKVMICVEKCVDTFGLFEDRVDENNVYTKAMYYVIFK